VRINKSYKLINYLNREHSAVSSYFLGFIGWASTMIATRSSALSRLVFNEFQCNNYTLGFRRSAWIFRRFWSNFSIIRDDFYDFTIGTNAKHREHLIRFLERVYASNHKMRHLTDCLYISAANLHENIVENQSELPISSQIVSFYDKADKVLDSLSLPSDEPIYHLERKADFSKGSAICALKDFASELSLDMWPWYVISGTLLGLHRENDFLLHDYDIDVGINAQDVSVEKLIDRLSCMTSFVVKKVDYHIEVISDPRRGVSLKKSPSLVKIVHINGMHIDVFIHYHEDSICWHGSIIHRWENTPFELERRFLRGIEVNAPKDADLYLTENYGDWRKPVKDFECTTGTPNLVIARNFLSVSLFVKKLAVYNDTSISKYEELVRILLATKVIESIGNGYKVVRHFSLKQQDLKA